MSKENIKQTLKDIQTQLNDLKIKLHSMENRIKNIELNEIKKDIPIETALHFKD